MAYFGGGILSKIELFCRVGNCWNWSKDVNGIDNQSQLENAIAKIPVENLHEERKKTWGNPMTPTTSTRLDFPCELHDLTTRSARLVGNVHDDSWEWHGK